MRPHSSSSADPATAAIVCKSCGSERVRRSSPKGVREKAVSRVLKGRFYVCSGCGCRGVRFGGSRHRHHASAPARPLERRDLREIRTRFRRMVSTVLLASILGAAAGYYMWSCEETREEHVVP